MKMTLVNKSHSKKWIGVLMASLLTASLLTGCGGDKKPAPAAGGAQPAATAAAAPEVKVEPALTGKIGSVNFSSQKLAGASFTAKSTQRGYMLRYKGDLVYGNAETKTWTALKVDSPKAAVDKSLFTDGVLKGAGGSAQEQAQLAAMIERFRARALALVDHLRGQGLAACISGAGPTVVVFHTGDEGALVDLAVEAASLDPRFAGFTSHSLRIGDGVQLVP